MTINCAALHGSQNIYFFLISHCCGCPVHLAFARFHRLLVRACTKPPVHLALPSLINKTTRCWNSLPWGKDSLTTKTGQSTIFLQRTMVLDLEVRYPILACSHSAACMQCMLKVMHWRSQKNNVIHKKERCNFEVRAQYPSHPGCVSPLAVSPPCAVSMHSGQIVLSPPHFMHLTTVVLTRPGISGLPRRTWPLCPHFGLFAPQKFHAMQKESKWGSGQGPGSSTNHQCEASQVRRNYDWLKKCL